MRVVYKKTTELRDYERNARTHSDEQVRQIAASIREFGFTNPVLLDQDNTIIAGHGRLAAARLLGLAEVPCIVLDHLTDAQRRAYILADNRIALNSGWDKELLAGELADLRGLIDLSLLGFREVELTELLPLDPIAGETDPDEIPVPSADICALGDVWQLGNHRLLCGDATAPESWPLLLGQEQLEWVWTDPPYNVDYGQKIEDLGKKTGKGTKYSAIINDNLPAQDFLKFLLAAMSGLHAAMVPGATIYITHAETERASFTTSFLLAGFKLSACLIWKKISWSSAGPIGSPSTSPSSTAGNRVLRITGPVAEKKPRSRNFLPGSRSASRRTDPSSSPSAIRSWPCPARQWGRCTPRLFCRWTSRKKTTSIPP